MAAFRNAEGGAAENAKKSLNGHGGVALVRMLDGKKIVRYMRWYL
jgi:hypothetical protein